MSKKRVASDRPPGRPPPLKARPKNQPLAALPTDDVRSLPLSSGASDRDGIVTAKSAKGATGNAVKTAGDRSPKSLTAARANVTETHIARRAYDLYLARGCEHGRDVEDWLRAERDLRAVVSSAKPRAM